MHVDELRPFGCVGLVEEGFDRYLGELHVGVVPRAVLVGELFGLHHHVPEVGARAPHGGEVKGFEDVEHLQCSETLWVGRQLPHREPAVGRGDRLHPLARVIREIRRREEPADLIRVGDDLLRDRPSVERVAAAGGQQLEGVGEGRVGEDIALGRHLAAGHEDLGETRAVGEARGAARPGAGYHLRHRSAFARHLGDRSEEVSHGEPAELLVQLEPPVGTPRNGPRVDRVHRDGAVVFGRHLVDGQRSRRAAGGVETVKLRSLRVPDHGKEIAAEPARYGLQKTEGGVGGDRRIDRRTAGLEHVEPDLHRQRMGGGDHPVAGIHHRAGRERAALGAVRGGGHGDGDEHQGQDDEAVHGNLRSIWYAKPQDSDFGFRISDFGFRISDFGFRQTGTLFLRGVQ